MKAWVELYVQQFKTTLAMMFQYRASLFIWMLGQVLEPLVYLIVWTVVSNQNGGSLSSFTTAQFASYFIILMLVNQFSFTWIMYEFDYRIREGIFSFALLKPVHPIHPDIADNISSKIITLPIMVVIAVLFGFFFHASISPSLWAIVLFLPALVLTFLVRFILEWTLSLAAFWTTRVSAINQTYFLLLLFLSGQIAPLPILPQPVQILAKVLPFYWTIGFPVEILLGGTSLADTLTGIGAQIGWFAISLILLRFVWRAGVKVYSAVGT